MAAAHRPSLIGQGRVQPQGERLAKLVQREPGQRPGNGRVTGRFVARKPQWLLEFVPMGSRPTHHHGHFRNPGQQAEKDQGHDA